MRQCVAHGHTKPSIHKNLVCVQQAQQALIHTSAAQSLSCVRGSLNQLSVNITISDWIFQVCEDYSVQFQTLPLLSFRLSDAFFIVSDLAWTRWYLHTDLILAIGLANILAGLDKSSCLFSNSSRHCNVIECSFQVAKAAIQK